MDFPSWEGSGVGSSETHDVHRSIMLKSLLQKVGIKSKNERTLAEYQPVVDEINALKEKFEKFSDEELRGMTEEFRKRIIENAVTRARERLKTDDRGLRKKLNEIFEEEEGGEFLAVSVKKYHNKVLMRILMMGLLRLQRKTRFLFIKERNLEKDAVFRQPLR